MMEWWWRVDVLRRVGQEEAHGETSCTGWQFSWVTLPPPPPRYGGGMGGHSSKEGLGRYQSVSGVYLSLLQVVPHPCCLFLGLTPSLS